MFVNALTRRSTYIGHFREKMAGENLYETYMEVAFEQ